MAVRKSQQKCVNKYIGTHYDRINLTVPKGKKEQIQAAAVEKGESVNAYLNRLIDEEFKRIEHSGGISHISHQEKSSKTVK